MSERIDMIRAKLNNAFAPEQLDIVDESHLHAGHPGARSGGGHFVATIVSESFAGKAMLARHRMVYEALGDAMQTEIHALSIKALTPAEAQK
jgi:BolA family transcriptional regulator, general stress-responsive regulator